MSGAGVYVPSDIWADADHTDAPPTDLTRCAALMSRCDGRPARRIGRLLCDGTATYLGWTYFKNWLTSRLNHIQKVGYLLEETGMLINELVVWSVSVDKNSSLVNISDS